MIQSIKAIWKNKMIFIMILSVGLLLLFLNRSTQTNEIEIPDANQEVSIQTDSTPYPLGETGYPDFAEYERFGEAFTMARHYLGRSHVFEWNGQLYSTDWQSDVYETKDEVE